MFKEPCKKKIFWNPYILKFQLRQVEEFKYLGVLFADDGRQEWEISRRIGQAVAVLRELYRTVVGKAELIKSQD
jgi:hypothetical protein